MPSKRLAVQRNWTGTAVTGILGLVNASLLLISLLRYLSVTFPAPLEGFIERMQAKLAGPKVFWYNWMALRWFLFSIFAFWALPFHRVNRSSPSASSGNDYYDDEEQSLWEQFFERRTPRARQQIIGTIVVLGFLHIVFSAVLVYYVLFRSGEKQWAVAAMTLASAAVYSAYSAAWVFERLERFVSPWLPATHDSVAV